MSDPSNSARVLDRTRDVERDVAVAHHHGARASKRWIEPLMIRMAVIPANERRRSDHAGQVAAGDVERAVRRRARREHDRVIEALQLAHLHIATDANIAHEAHARIERDLFVAPRHGLDRLVVGRDAEADEAVGNGQPVDQVDPRRLAEQLERRLGRVEPRRPGPDHCDATHGASCAWNVEGSPATTPRKPQVGRSAPARPSPSRGSTFVQVGRANGGVHRVRAGQAERAYYLWRR